MDRGNPDTSLTPSSSSSGSDHTIPETIPGEVTVENVGPDVTEQTEPKLFLGGVDRTQSPDTIQVSVDVHAADSGKRAKPASNSAFQRVKRLSQIRRDLASGKRQLKTKEIAKAYGPEMASTPGRGLMERLLALSTGRKSKARATTRATSKRTTPQRSRSSSRGEASEDEDARLIRGLESRRQRKFRFEDEDRIDQAERGGPDHADLWRNLTTVVQQGRKYGQLKRTMDESRRSWDDARQHMVPFVAAIAETVLEFERPFFVLRYEVTDPLGQKKVKYRRINDVEDWNSVVFNLNVSGPNTSNHRIIQRGDPEEQKVINPDENDPNLRWIPVDEADARLNPQTDRMREILTAVEGVLITPEVIVKHLENGETVRLSQKGSTQEEPREADGIVHLNVPQRLFGEIAIGSKDIILSTIDGVPTIRLKSGAVVAHDKQKEQWQLFGYNQDQDWPFTTLLRLEDIDARRNLSDEEVDTVFELAKKNQEEKKELEKDLTELVTLLDEREEEITGLKQAAEECKELRKKLEDCELNLALKRSTEPDAGESDDPLGAPAVDSDPREKPIESLNAASQNKMLLSSIELWGKDNNSPPARPWIKASIHACRVLKVNEGIIADFLALRLKPIERNRMGELKGEGKITTLDSFVTQFLENYGKRGSPLSQLRALLTRKMSVHEIQVSAYYEYANRLELDAHEAYVAMDIDRKMWPIIDKVLVVSAYFSAVPAELSQHLMLEDVDSLEQATKESRKWANALVDSRGRSALGAVVGGAQGGQGRGQGQNGQNRRGDRQQQHQNQHQGGQQQRGQRDQQERQPPPANGGQQGGQGGGQGGQDGQQQDRPRDALCRQCRGLETPPVSCDHCRKCGNSGHRAWQCRKRS